MNEILKLNSDIFVFDNASFSLNELLRIHNPLNLKLYDIFLSFNWARNCILMISENNLPSNFGISFYINCAYIYYNNCIDYIIIYIIYKNLKYLTKTGNKIYSFDINNGLPKKSLTGKNFGTIKNDLQTVAIEDYNALESFYRSDSFKNIRIEGANILKHFKILKMEDTYFGKVPYVDDSHPEFTRVCAGSSDSKYNTTNCLNNLIMFNNEFAKLTNLICS